MKRSILIICTLLLTTAHLLAQQSTYVKEPGYWIFGINGGLAYQQSDVPSLLKGYGGGLTLGKNLYYEPNAPFSFDLRGRLLLTRSYGLDHARSMGIDNNDALNGENQIDYSLEGGGPGYVFQNNKTDLAELGLEGVLTFNQLRERHNIILSLYGGAGFDWYKTKIDQRDANGLYTDAYNGIDPNRSVSSIKANLKENILDGDYETNAHGFGDAGKLRIMPSLGIELGYQLTPRFSAGIGHRVTFTGTDVFDGHQWNNDNTLTGDKDLHHYTSLHLRWEIPSKERKLYAPLITITRPTANPYSTRDPNATVKATIKHVNSAVDVTCTFNGRPISFDFYKQNFSANCLLEPGRNELIITASNSVGNDQKQQVLIYQENIISNPDPLRRPEVDITNPPRDNYRVQDDRFTIRAKVRNIERKGDIYFLFNGRTSNDFTYDSRSNNFSANVRLREGNNDFRIEANNTAGSDLDDATVILEAFRPEPPSVRITKPTRNPYETDKDKVFIEAKTTRVERASDINYKVNGRTVSKFDYTNDIFCADAYLKEGRNTVTIRVSNPDGTDQDEIIIIYTPRAAELPEVRITDPNREYTSTTRSRQSVRASVKNVDRKDQISMYVNGRRSSSFSFNNRSGTIGATVDLELGDNDVSFVVQTQSGQDEDKVVINYEKEVVVVPTRKPQVTISRPSDNSTSSTDEIAVEAQLLHVSSKNDIEFRVNGSRSSNFNFDLRRKRLTANIRLREGSNTIWVEGRNRDGRDEDEVRVNYRRQSNPPSVDITRPSASTSTTDQARIDFRANVSKVDRKSDIRMSLNGRNFTNFSYNNNEVRATLDLREGDNKVIIKVSNRDGNDEDSATIRYRRESNPPSVDITRPSASNSTTDKATADFRANVTKVDRKGDIRMSLNGRSFTNFSFNNNEVRATLNLREGENKVVISVSNNDGSDEDSATIKYRRESNPPSVTITRPSASVSTTDKATADFKAEVINVTSKRDIQMTLNGKSYTNFSFSRQTVTARLPLREGDNKVVIKVSNKDGNDQDNATIKYRREANPPSVTITSPSSSNSTTDKDKASFKAKTVNVAGKGDIAITFNGKRISNFSYNSSRKEVTTTLSLKEGDNKVTIKVTNKDGSDEDSATIRYKRKLAPPTVRITSPNPKGALSTDETSIKATITNVASKNDITFTVNGKQVKDFSFSKQAFNGKARLKAGANKIEIKASNKAGSDTDQITLTYRPTIPKPVVKFLKPAKSGTKVTTKRFAVQASILNVKSQKDITFKVNGKANKNFKYDSRAKRVSATIGLKRGKNTLEFIAKNSAGEASAKTTITLEQQVVLIPKKPKIESFNTSAPVVNPFEPNVARITVSATLINISSKDQIQFSLNGKAVTDFSFSSKTGQFSGRVLLKRGMNILKLVATNKEGSVEKIEEVEF